VNHAHIVKIANMAQLVNVIAPIFTSKDALFLQTIYYPLQLFATHCRGKALDLLVESPTYNSKKFGAVPYLDVSAAYNSDGSIVLNVTNRHRDHPLDAVFEVVSKRFNSCQSHQLRDRCRETLPHQDSEIDRTAQLKHSAADSTLQQRPEVLKSVGMNVAIHVGYSVIYN
jgi:alpha-L-arabinofuranosidase